MSFLQSPVIGRVKGTSVKLLNRSPVQSCNCRVAFPGSPDGVVDWRHRDLVVWAVGGLAGLILFDGLA